MMMERTTHHREHSLRRLPPQRYTLYCHLELICTSWSRRSDEADDEEEESTSFKDKNRQEHGVFYSRGNLMNKAGCVLAPQRAKFLYTSPNRVCVSNCLISFYWRSRYITISYALNSFVSPQFTYSLKVTIRGYLISHSQPSQFQFWSETRGRNHLAWLHLLSKPNGWDHNINNNSINRRQRVISNSNPCNQIHQLKFINKRSSHH